MGPYQPETSVAVKLQAAGYHTLYGGKFLNRLPRYSREPEEMLAIAQGWDEFDVIWTNHGKFYQYPFWTRSGTEIHKDAPEDHSTFVTTVHMQRHIAEAPPDKPLQPTGLAAV